MTIPLSYSSAGLMNLTFLTTQWASFSIMGWGGPRSVYHIACWLGVSALEVEGADLKFCMHAHTSRVYNPVLTSWKSPLTTLWVWGRRWVVVPLPCMPWDEWKVLCFMLNSVVLFKWYPGSWKMTGKLPFCKCWIPGWLGVPFDHLDSDA